MTPQHFLQDRFETDRGSSCALVEELFVQVLGAKFILLRLGLRPLLPIPIAISSSGLCL